MRKLETTDQRGNFIGGQWTPPTTGDFEPNRNPADSNDVVGHFARSGADDAKAAIAAAAAAAPAWGQTPAPERGRVLARTALLIRDRLDLFAQTLCREEGKTVAESKGEILKGVALLEWYAGEGFRLGGKVVPSEMRKTLTYTFRQPLGVVVLITPWNFPFAIPVWKSAPALVAGNAVVMKPASLTPATAALLAEAYDEAGLPKGVFNLVTGPGGAVGNTLVDDVRVRAISFTGSNGIGMALAERAAKRGVRVTCEMGGKNPVVVMDDADLDQATAGILNGAFGSTGQRCTATSRVVAHAAIASALTERLVAGAKTLKVGNGQSAGIDMGPAVDKSQLKTDADYLQIAQAEGAQLLTGGKLLDQGEHARGFFVEPTIFGGVTGTMRIAQEEVFGPVLSILRAESFEEAVALANHVEFGLASSIYTRDANQAMRFVEQSEVGMVHVNNPTVGGEAALPFGGIKSTGLGSREMSEEGADFFCEQKTVFFDYTGAARTSKIY
jgi:acyl-CoA reductase-like NAD-dependent aldehyde dehydrogenase